MYRHSQEYALLVGRKLIFLHYCVNRCIPIQCEWWYCLWLTLDIFQHLSLYLNVQYNVQMQWKPILFVVLSNNDAARVGGSQAHHFYDSSVVEGKGRCICVTDVHR